MVSYLCEITTHRGQCFHPTPPPYFTKQGKTRTQKFATKKSNSIVAVWFFINLKFSRFYLIYKFYFHINQEFLY